MSLAFTSTPLSAAQARVEYFRSQHAADHALAKGRWQQRIHP